MDINILLIDNIHTINETKEPYNIFLLILLLYYINIPNYYKIFYYH